MAVEKGSKVKIEYEGKLDDGTVFDSSNKTGESQPLEFVAGEGQIIPGLDNAILGMEEGEEKNVEVSPEEGYGKPNPELKKEIPKSSLPQDREPQQGMILMVSTPEGQQFPATIEEIKDENIVLDLNHPLSGKKLHFNVKVVGIDKPEETPAA